MGDGIERISKEHKMSEFLIYFLKLMESFMAIEIARLSKVSEVIRKVLEQDLKTKIDPRPMDFFPTLALEPESVAFLGSLGAGKVGSTDCKFDTPEGAEQLGESKKVSNSGVIQTLEPAGILWGQELEQRKESLSWGTSFCGETV